MTLKKIHRLRKHRSKVLVTLLLLLLVVGSMQLFSLFNKNNDQAYCSDKMEKLDTKEYLSSNHLLEETDGETNIHLSENDGIREIISGDAWLRISPTNNNILSTNTSIYKDAVHSIFDLNEDDNRELSFNLEIPEGYQLSGPGAGGYITLNSKKSGEEVMMLQYPQGIDKDGNRLDYKYKLDGNKLKLTLNRDWQTGCTKFPVSVHQVVNNVSWSEAIVKVGENGVGEGKTRDGDILMIKPAGFNWGTKASKSYAIVKVPKMLKTERDNYSHETSIEKSEEEYLSIYEYGIDYTQLADSNQLSAIRDPEKISPVLDATDKPEVIIKKDKNKLLSSVVNPELYLAERPVHKPTLEEKIKDTLVPPVYAATNVSTIGTASRNYATITLWEDAVDGVLSNVEQGVVYDDSSFDEQVDIDDSTTSATAYVHLTVFPPDRHKGIAGSGARIDLTGTSTDNCGATWHTLICIADAYTIIEWMEITESTATIGGGGNGIGIRTTDENATIRYNFIHNLDWYNNTRGIITGQVSIDVYNNFVHTVNSGGITYITTLTGKTAYYYNNTVYNAGGGFTLENTFGAGSTVTAKNNIALVTSGSDFFLDTVVTGANLSSDSTANNDCDDADCFINQTTADVIKSIVAGSVDLHLKSGSQAINQGQDLSVTFTDDIDSETRPIDFAWDIGADEFHPIETKRAIAEWKFNEGVDDSCPNGGDTCDSSGNENEGAVTGGTAWQTEDLCMSGKCLYFDMTDDIVTVTNAPEVDPDSFLAPGHTYEFWVRVNSDGEANVGEIYEIGGGNYARITNEGADGLADLEVSVDLGTNATLTITNGITLNQWQHIAIGYTDDSDDEITIYIDGVDRGSSINGVGPVDGNTSNLVIGGDTAANFHGFIDEFRVYDYERTAAEILTDLINLSSNRGSTASFGPDNSYLSDGLVGYWKMDETATPSTDLSGNGYDNTWYGNTTNGLGKYGNSISLDGTDDYVAQTDSGQFDNLTNVSVSSWVKLSATGINQFVVDKYDGSGRDNGIGINNSNFPYFEIVTGGSSYGTTATTALGTTSWYHLAGTYDGETVRIYVNGVLENSNTSPSGDVDMDSASDYCFTIGGQFSSATCSTTTSLDVDFNGTIDDVRVYNRALSPAEVRGLYNWAPGPVGYWPMDENTGSTAFDKSGNGNNGTISNSAWKRGRFGSGLGTEIDGVQDVATISNPASGILDFTDSSDYTVSAWIRGTQSESTSHLVRKNYTGSPNTAGYALGITEGGGAGSGKCSYTDGDGSGFDEAQWASANLNDGVWHLVSCVMDRDGFETGTSGGLYIYVDGILRGSDGSLTEGSSSNSGDVTIGERSDSTEWKDGVVDEVRIYNYARTPGQIIEDMNGGHPLGGSPIGSQLAYWSFDEMYGDTANDKGTGGNNGDLGESDTTCPASGVDCPTWTASGKVNGTLEFDGVNDVINVGDVTDLELTFPVTFSSWVQLGSLPSTDEEREILTKYNAGGNNRAWSFSFTASDKFGFYKTENGSTGTGELIESDTTFVAGDLDKWMHLAVSIDSEGNYKFYLDGKEDGSGTLSSTTMFTTGTANVFIGAVDQSLTNPDHFYDGLIDELKIYNAALTADQILIDMNAGSNAAFSVLGSTEAADITGGAGDPPIGYWDLNENTGTGAVVNDKSGNGNTGTMEASMTESDWVPGKYSSALDFDGSDDVVAISDDTTLDFSGFSGLTVVGWIRPTSDTNDGNMYSHWNSSASNRTVLVAYEGTNDRFNCGTNAFDGQANSTSTITMNVWYHVACVWTASTSLEIYVNGVLENTDSTVQATLDGNTADHAIGARSQAVASFDEFFEGQIDEVSVYDYARTPAQIAYDFNRGRPVGHWKFDECQGTTANDSGSGGNNGTITPGGAPNTSAGTCSSGAGDEMWDNGTTGKRNASLDFDGTDDYVDMNDVNTVDFNDQDFSISGWLYKSTNSNEMILAKRNSLGGDPGFIVGILTNILFIEVEDSGGDQYSIQTSAAVGSTSVWYHFAVVWDDDTEANTKIYINGAEDTTNPIGTFGDIGDLSNGVDLRLGGESDGGNPFEGQLDDMRIYNYALSANQILNIMNHGAAFFGPNTGSP